MSKLAVLSAHLETWRLFISLNAGLTALAGATVVLRGLPDAATAAVIFAVPVIGYLGALYGTDFKDRNEDALTRPHRPIPSGRISEDGAIIYMLLFVGAGFLGASWLGFPAVIATCAAMAVGIVRAKVKSWGVVAPATRSLGTGANFLFGAVAVNPTPSTAAWLITLAFLLDTFPKSVVGGLWDMAADRATGVRTMWVRHGVPATSAIVLTAILLLLVYVAMVPQLVAGLDPVRYYVVFVLFAALTIVGAKRLVDARADRDAALSSLDWLLRGKSLLAASVIIGFDGSAGAVAVVGVVILAGEMARWHLMRPLMYRVSFSSTTGLSARDER